MDKKTEALKLALDALDEFCELGAILRPIEVRDAIREALTQQQEPVVQKPTVKYSEFIAINTAEHPELGLVFWANIRGVRGHYRLGNAISVTTSQLVTLPDSKGRFETLNTVYEME